MTKNIDKLGWFVAVALAGAMIGMGMKAPGDKVGTVDIVKVFSDSDFEKKQNTQLTAMGMLRQGVMDLVRQYQVMNPVDAQKFKDLSLKEKQTPEDKAELDRITQTAKAADTEYRALSTKASPTPIEVAQLEELNRHKEQNQGLAQKWEQEFEGDVNSLKEKLRADALTKVREAVSQVAKDDGYSIVFLTDVAPYSSNDLTEASTKVMSKKFGGGP